MKAFRAWPIILIIMLSSPALAQWEYGGKWIGYYTSGTALAMVTDTVTGNTFVAWNKLYGGDQDIFIQCVDSAGYALWDEGGMVVYEDDYYTQWYVSLLADGEGGVFVVWTDYRHTPDEGAELYGQRIDDQGNFLWNLEGMKLTADTATHRNPALYDDGYGGFVAVCRKSYGGDTNVGAQRVNSQGQIQWDSTGILLTTANRDQGDARTCRASDNTFITIWRDWRDSHDYDSDIYMQSFDLDGNILWEPDGTPAVHWPYHQGYLDNGHDVAADGQGGAVVVWVDRRLDNIGNPVLFADRFSPQGESMWQSNGMKLGFEDSNGALACHVFRMALGFMFTWEKNGGGFEATYTNYFGDFFWQDTVRVLDPRSDSESLVLAESDSTIIYVSVSNEGGLHRFGSKIDLNGNQYWPNEPYLDDFLDLIQIALDGQGGMVASWIVRQTGEIEIGRIYADGHVGGDTTTAIYDEDIPNLPEAITLFQNYPNPFNSNTVIKYSVRELGSVTLAIYDLLGRELYWEDIEPFNIGINSVKLDMNGMRSGVYFARITSAKGKSATIKMILLK